MALFCLSIRIRQPHALVLGLGRGQLDVIERLLLAPLKDHAIAIEHCYVSIVRQNFMDSPFQTHERCCTDWQDFNAVSDLETRHIRSRAGSRCLIVWRREILAGGDTHTRQNLPDGVHVRSLALHDQD